MTGRRKENMMRWTDRAQWVNNGNSRGHWLKDAKTDELIEVATEAQVAASDAADGADQNEGIFWIDKHGTPVASSNFSRNRRVYTDVE